ncbi:MAG: electron transfer flavoprotein subunit beta/FixA family protein [Longimicrobiales bacterium]
MKSVVCIKRVPDTEARIRIKDDKSAIDAAGIKFVISPYDEFAIEAAISFKDVNGTGEVVVLSVGDASAAEQLRSALARGADRAVLLKGEPTMDGLATARALAAEIKPLNTDVILFGMKAVDDDQQQVGPMVAELLGLPCVTVVAEFEIENDKAICHREVEGGIEVVETPLPAVIAITKGKYEPRYPSLKGIMAAKKKPLEEKPAQLGNTRVQLRDLSYPPERPPGKIVGTGVDAVPELVRVLREEAKVL